MKKIVAGAGLALMGLAYAATAAADANAQAEKGLAQDAQCTVCHNEAWRKPVLSLYQTRHGNRADPRAPLCMSCHGPSDNHRADPSAHPDYVFAGKNKLDPTVMNEQCLGCHKGDPKRMHWQGSTHQGRDVACVNCHEIHTPHDKVRDKLTQPEVCFACHKEQRTQINKPSHHPIPEGKMACSDCHNPHGSTGPKLMKRDSVNDTCYTCHMEKRGPFVHVHEPVAEDCSNCHNPHGTTAENMLKARPPFLCHQCHTPHGANVAQLAGQGQPSSLLSAITGGKSGINYTMARGCVNCHTQVHGTNNPSTTNPTPQFNFR